MKLQDVQVADTPLEECTKCGGIWVDIASFEFICANAEAQTAVVDLQLPAPVRVHYLPCPQCGNLMSRTNYASRSGVIINICRAHGIWLDREQMRQIIEFVRAGGLDRARRIEKEELAEERRAIAFDPADTETFLAPSPFHESVNSSDRAHLIRGIASLKNHFLGEE